LLRTVLFVFGTRPEAIKLAPLVLQLRGRPNEFAVKICVTAQHREMLDQVLDVFDFKPDYDLDVMTPGQSLTQVTARILAKLEPVMIDAKPHVILVQGDTSSTLCGALAGFYSGVAVGHVEAGLRTGDIKQPFPEEMNRLLVSRLASIHFAATPMAAKNLLTEGTNRDTVHVTGNTGIDAVLYVRDRLAAGSLPMVQWPFLDARKKLVLVTAHRRESFGQGFEQICAALRHISEFPDIQLVIPVHPNPNASGPIRHILGNCPNIFLVDPLDYVSFVDLMRRCYLLITDSGGIQEEAPSLGKPVLVLREKTERPEAVEAGTATLVGVDTRKIVLAAETLIVDDQEYARRCRIHNPYGDGHASERIADMLQNWPVAA
jgi:UDP-N-acetylglucosamine 2-epimerase (non-hydrolysing)